MKQLVFRETFGKHGHQRAIRLTTRMLIVSLYVYLATQDTYHFTKIATYKCKMTCVETIRNALCRRPTPFNAKVFIYSENEDQMT